VDGGSLPPCGSSTRRGGVYPRPPAATVALAPQPPPRRGRPLQRVHRDHGGHRKRIPLRNPGRQEGRETPEAGRQLLASWLPQGSSLRGAVSRSDCRSVQVCMLETASVTEEARLVGHLLPRYKPILGVTVSRLTTCHCRQQPRQPSPRSALLAARYTSHLT